MLRERDHSLVIVIQNCTVQFSPVDNKQTYWMNYKLLHILLISYVVCCIYVHSVVIIFSGFSAIVAIRTSQWKKSSIVLLL